MTKMTLDELHALRPKWQQRGPAQSIEHTVEQFCWHGVQATDPHTLHINVLMEIFGGAVLAQSQPDTPDAARVFASAVVREYGDRIRRFQGSAPAAWEWLQRNQHVAKKYLHGWVRCPNDHRLAELYCLPKNAAPVVDSGGLRLLIKPKYRGRLVEVGARDDAAIPARGAWWYVSDDDLWELSCRHCRLPGTTMPAREFFDVAPGRGYSVVLT